MAARKKIAGSFVPFSSVEGYVIFSPHRANVLCAALRIYWLV